MHYNIILWRLAASESRGETERYTIQAVNNVQSPAKLKEQFTHKLKCSDAGLSETTEAADLDEAIFRWLISTS